MEQDDLIPLEDLCRYYSVEFTFVSGLSEYELLDLVLVEQTPCLRKSQLADFEKLLRLHYELDINMAGIDAIVHLLQRIKQLQLEVKELRLRENAGHFGEYPEPLD
ncbi:MAG: chaperone modulator CbpM [Bacteroidia bacterium]|nr:chaperone modulator CbpM [Bacteroidia bacterium]